MVNFQVGWYRFVPFLGYHHVLMILLLIAIICYSIVMAGCTTTGLSSVYLLSLSYVKSSNETAKPDSGQSNPNITSTFSSLATSANETRLQVRASYLGLCVKESAGDWICSSSISSLAKIFKISSSEATTSHDGGADPLNIVWIAGKFRQEIVFDGLIFTALPLAFIAFLLLATFPGWHEEVDEDGSEREVKPFPSRPVSQMCLGIVSLSTIFLFVSVFWQHIAAASTSTMAEALSYGMVDGHVGAAAMALGWVAFALTTISMIGLLVLILSIRVLSDMVDSTTTSSGRSTTSDARSSGVEVTEGPTRPGIPYAKAPPGFRAGPPPPPPGMFPPGYRLGPGQGPPPPPGMYMPPQGIVIEPVKGTKKASRRHSKV